MKCNICEKEVSMNDPTYPNVHHDCQVQFFNEMEKLKVINVHDKMGTDVSYSFTDSFQEALDKILRDVRYHTITDETVDDDIVTMKGVIRAVIDYFPKDMPDRKLWACSELVFNSLMVLIYGRPVPDDKKFHSRVEEFLEEVTSIPINDKNMEESLKAWKRIISNK